MHHHLTHLKKNGLNVVTRSPWHYQVVHGRIVINVWPTSRKWMVAYDTGASLYKDASDLFRIVTKVIEERAPIVMPPVTDAELEWRDGLDILKYEIAEELSTYYQNNHLTKAV